MLGTYQNVSWDSTEKKLFHSKCNRNHRMSNRNTFSQKISNIQYSSQLKSNKENCCRETMIFFISFFATFKHFQMPWTFFPVALVHISIFHKNTWAFCVWSEWKLLWICHLINIAIIECFLFMFSFIFGYFIPFSWHFFILKFRFCSLSLCIESFSVFSYIKYSCISRLHWNLGWC